MPCKSMLARKFERRQKKRIIIINKSISDNNRPPREDKILIGFKKAGKGLISAEKRGFKKFKRKPLFKKGLKKRIKKVKFTLF